MQRSCSSFRTPAGSQSPPRPLVWGPHRGVGSETPRCGALLSAHPGGGDRAPCIVPRPAGTRAGSAPATSPRSAQLCAPAAVTPRLQRVSPQDSRAAGARGRGGSLCRAGTARDGAWPGRPSEFANRRRSKSHQERGGFQQSPALKHFIFSFQLIQSKEFKKLY